MSTPPNWSRTNRLIVRAVEELGGRALPVSSEHTDFFLRLEAAGKSALISKTRSPFLTQVAQTLANNKFVAGECLGARGFPVVPRLLLDESRGLDTPGVSQSLDGWGRLVFKPNWGNRALGVTVDPPASRREAAVEWARGEDRDEECVVEPWVEGVDLRISVVGGRPVAAVEIQRPSIASASGISFRERLQNLAADPRRVHWQRPRLEALDHFEPEDYEDALDVLGYSLDDEVPAGLDWTILGEEVEVVDRRSEVHVEWFELAAQACRVLGVDVGGVDLRGPLEAFARPPVIEAWSQGRPVARLLEVNALPALHLHELVTQGEPVAVFEAFVRYCLQLEGAPAPGGAPRLDLGWPAPR